MGVMCVTRLVQATLDCVTSESRMVRPSAPDPPRLPARLLPANVWVSRLLARTGAVIRRPITGPGRRASVRRSALPSDGTTVVCNRRAEAGKPVGGAVRTDAVPCAGMSDPGGSPTCYAL